MAREFYRRFRMAIVAGRPRHKSENGTVLINHRTEQTASGGRHLSYPGWRIPIPNDVLS